MGETLTDTAADTLVDAPVTPAADATDTPQPFPGGYVGGFRRMLANGPTDWSILACEVGPAGPAEDIERLQREIDTEVEAERLRANAVRKYAIESVPSAERDRLRKQVQEMEAERDRLTAEKKAAEKETARALRRGENPLPHEAVAESARSQRNRIMQRLTVVRQLLQAAEEAHRAACAAARREAVLMQRAELRATLLQTSAEIGNVIARHLPKLTAARQVLSELQE